MLFCVQCDLRQLSTSCIAMKFLYYSYFMILGGYFYLLILIKMHI